MNGFLKRAFEEYDPNIHLKGHDEGTGEIEVMFGHHNSVDSDNDVIRKGAYDKTIVENRKRIKHFKNHNENLTPGVIKDIRNTDEGIIMISQLMLKHSVGSDTYEEYKYGVITEHSQGFYTIKENKLDNGTREITELKLMEISSLTHWGANEYTPTLNVKSLQTIDDANAYLVRLGNLLSKSNISDLKGRAYEELYAKLKSLLANAPEPGNHSSEANEPVFDISKLKQEFKNLT